MNINAAFQWECQPRAEKFLLNLLDQAVHLNPFINQLDKDLLEKTSTRLFDWVDHFVINRTQEVEEELIDSGFILESESPFPIYRHPGAQLPRVALKSIDHPILGVALSVESIDDFLMVRGGIPTKIEGTPYSGYRRCLVNEDHRVSLWVIERRGNLTLEPTEESTESIVNYLHAKERWQNRLRALEDEDEAMRQTLSLAQELIQTLGQHRAAWLVLECERHYWQVRNTAGQIQKNRQDRLGMGWANHDHHTFRSSRRRFSQLVHLFELLGFHCRERFYAGQEAGWGAQVMENPICKLVLFLDVDLAPHEIEEDFAHQPLPDLPQLGTIGLWCALHGDSILKAGMHHLEAQFMFEDLTEDLAKAGIKMMNPFSSFPYLKQAFTAGEIWSVDSKRVHQLQKEGKITKEQADKFLQQGAIGSHLENLQRREGYKGFNQKNVSIIIKKTDPRQASSN